MPHTNEAAIEAAVDALSSGRATSIRATATLYGISRVTLTRRLDGTPTRSIARQSQYLLSQGQEEALLKWIIELEAIGHAISHTQIREMAGLFSGFSGGPSTVGSKWVQRFVQRHSIVHTKVGRAIDHLRVEAVTPDALKSWFELFRRIKLDYRIKPENIWNMDETGLALGHCKNQMVIGTSNTKYSYVKSPEDREWVSIVETISATGRRCRPLCIFKGKSIQTSWFVPENVPDFLFTTSENGWTSNSIGLRWLDEIFLPETANNGEMRLLLVDGHGSHTSTEFMWKCYENDV
jgi:DDE superfamily endonuclease/Tc5 transposase DNA-binding domain/helix-turn-helix, Psq domain